MGVWLSKYLINHNGALPGCTVHFDWLKSWEAGAPVFPKHSDLNDQNLFHSTIDAPPGVPGVSKNLGDQTEVHSGELER